MPTEARTWSELAFVESCEVFTTASGTTGMYCYSPSTALYTWSFLTMIVLGSTLLVARLFFKK